MANRDTKKVYLHIGFGKTGTSSIQDMLFNNMAVFAEHGLLYPKIGLWKSSHHKLTILPKQDNYIDEIQNDLNTIKSDFLNSSYQKLLISSENLCFTKRELIEKYGEIFGCFETHIIFYVRRQESLIPSVYLEWVKNGWDYQENIREFFIATKNAYNFLIRLSNWESLFGKDAIVVRVYDDKLFKDVSEDFLDCIDMTVLKNRLKFYKSNLSLSVAFLDTIRFLDNLKLETNIRKTFIEEFVKVSNHIKCFPNETILSEELRSQIADTYARSNQELANRYLDQNQKHFFLKRL